MIRIAIDQFVVPNNTEGIRNFAFVYAALVIWQGINVYLLISLGGKIETGLSYSIREAGFKRLQELPFSFYDNKAVGWLMARMTSDSERLGEMVSWGIAFHC